MTDMKATLHCALIGSLFLLLGCRDEGNSDAGLEQAFNSLPPVRDADEIEFLPGQEEVIQLCDDFMATLADSEVENAFDVIRDISLLSREELDPLETTTKNQIKIVEPRYGKIVGYERVKVESPAPSLLTCTYLLKHERHALRWTFLFYKPKEEWFLNSFTWDDQITEM